MKHYIIPIFVPNEGCPHNCVFCDQTAITGNEEKVDACFTRNTINQYLKTIKRENSVVEVSFFGGTFTAIPMERQNELLSVAKEYKDRGDIDLIHMSTRPDYIDKSILDNLKSYSVDVIELGVQSLNEEVLIKSGRGHSADDVVKASSLIREYGFTLGHQIMLGLPSDTFEKDMETVKRSVLMNPDIYRLYPALVIKGTFMETMYKKGVYKPYTLDEAVDICRNLYYILRKNKINVIRMGLQPTEEINVGKDVIAGPFHPAFRELVEGSIYNSMIEDSISEYYEGNVVIKINNRDISKLYANKRKYFNEMKKKFGKCFVKVIQDLSISRENIVIIEEGVTKSISIDEYIEDKCKER
ncbi:elongator complex protein 3 [Clostridium coskatii]|uniref:Oxygen-independent coproporphyrinogen-III oxidase 1 n=1 Tax=Clostridium coskatii TaxID=1705578 RepID=A0A166TZ50_9CLOT|nr:radical SAM protein [Clostridium coskatii]OAA94371.1 Oxygen-independent coproporphyrinogen-III oxidase 1 [Clostridium coskatii]OBR93115.1 oxygen-independent coproporphyrinogen-III oxidase-like protein YqeR [Clostridium coskatii]